MLNSIAALAEARKLLSTGDVAGAMNVLQSLLQSEPDNAQALVALGVLCERTGRLDTAEPCLRRALGSSDLSGPRRAEVLLQLARVLSRLGRAEDALSALREAARVQPDSVKPVRALGDALYALHRVAESVPCYEKALAMDASDWRSLNNLALALLGLERPGEAEGFLRRAVETAPGEITCLNNLGEALLRQFDAAGAEEVFARACTLAPGHQLALVGRARAQAAAGRLDESRETARALPPGFPFPGPETAFVSWQLERLAACDWGDYEATLQRIRQLTRTALDEGRVPGLKPLAALERFGDDREFCKAIAGAWSKATREHVGVVEAPPMPNRDARLRIGYASPDFRVHPVAFLLRDLLVHHDRARFELFAYALQPADGSELAQSIRESVDHFVDLSGADDQAAGARIRNDKLHLLVDAAGYTAESRPAVFAARPAPLQVSYLGFFGSMQADWIDYLVANDTLLPASDERDYSETPIRVEPIPFVSAGFGEAGRASRAEHGLPADAVVMACFHRSSKFDPIVFKAWMRILEDAPRAVLWLRGDNAQQQENLRERVEAAGIDRARVVFASHVPFAEHLARHRLADLALDVFGFGGFNTNAIALWCGLPLLTVPGDSFASRAGAAAMQACGLGDAIATDMDDYVKRAIKWCTCTDQLEALKGRAMGARDKALFDAAATTTRVERAWLEIVEQAAAGNAPAAVVVKD